MKSAVRAAGGGEEWEKIVQCMESRLVDNRTGQTDNIYLFIYLFIYLSI